DVGERYRTGNGVPQHLPKAFSFFDKACNGKDSAGCLRVALSLAYGLGTNKDAGRAVDIFRKACDAKDPQGCAFYGKALIHGLGKTPEDKVKGLQLLTASCERAAVTCGDLAFEFLDGGSQPRDEKPATELFDKACAAGDDLSCSNFSLMLACGTGVQRDDVRAMKLT